MGNLKAYALGAANGFGKEYFTALYHYNTSAEHQCERTPWELSSLFVAFLQV
jgi:hypothetical protein